VLPQAVKQPKKVAQSSQQKKRLEIIFRMRMLHVPVEALKFEAIGNKERAKTWRNVHMNVFGLPLQVLHEFHPGITTEMQE